MDTATTWEEDLGLNGAIGKVESVDEELSPGHLLHGHVAGPVDENAQPYAAPLLHLLHVRVEFLRLEHDDGLAGGPAVGILDAVEEEHDPGVVDGRQKKPDLAGKARRAETALKLDSVPVCQG